MRTEDKSKYFDVDYSRYEANKPKAKKKKKNKAKRLSLKVDKVEEKGKYTYVEGEGLHRIVWKSQHGIIPQGWVVHHIDGDPSNNNYYNLVALPNDEHVKIHKQYPLPSRDVLMPLYYSLFERYLELQSQKDSILESLAKVDSQLQDMGVDTSRTAPKNIDRSMRHNKIKLQNYFDFAKVERNSVLPPKPTKTVLRKAEGSVRDLGYDPDQDPFDNPRDFS